MSTARKPWDRIDGEPSVWFDRFNRFYRPLGPSRTLTEAYRVYYEEKNGAPPTRPGYTSEWGKKSTLYEWQRRAEAWDEEIHKEAIAVEREASIEMTKRQVQDANAVQTLAMNEIIKKGFATENVGAIVRAWKAAVEVERTARGIPEILAKIGEMDDDELKRTLARELARASIREETGRLISEPDGEDAGFFEGSAEPWNEDTVSGPEISSAGGVSETSGEIRDGDTSSETEVVSGEDTTDISDE